MQTIGIAASGKPINPAKHCGCPSPEIEYTNSLILWDLNGRPWRTILELFCSGLRGKGIGVRGLPFIHDKTVDERGTAGSRLFHDRATCPISDYDVHSPVGPMRLYKLHLLQILLLGNT